jgi:steroid delta-isomerase-like uncharacterized protein
MDAKNPTPTPSTSLDVVAQYSTALASGDSEMMKSLRANECILDIVTRDAFGTEPLSCDETGDFWAAWFDGFPEMDYEVTRTIASEEVVVTQWTFIGTNNGPIPPILDTDQGPTGRTIRLRGVSIYDIEDGLIKRETNYMDLGTLLVELGIEL